MAGTFFNFKEELKYMKLNPRVYSPMQEALVTGNNARVRLLLKVGVSPNQRDKVGRTPLIIVSYFTNESKAVSLARSLIKRGGRIDYADDRGMNALHHACEKGRETLVDTLLKHKDGFDITVQDKSGKTCFDYAEKSGNLKIIATLRSLAEEYCWSPCIYSAVKETAEEPTSPTTIKLNDFRLCEEADRGGRKRSDGIEAWGLDNGNVPAEIRRNRSEHRNVEVIKPRPEIVRSTRYTRNEKKKGRVKKIGPKISLQSSTSEPTSTKENDIEDSVDKTPASSERTNQIDVSMSSCRQAGRSRETRSTKDQLVEIYKIFEQQKSEAYRDGARKPVIFPHSNSVSPMSSIFLEDDESPRVPSGRSSRSMSLVPGTFPNAIGARKRRPSRVSLQMNVNVQPGDGKNRIKSLHQRRFSAVTAPSFTLEQQVSPRARSDLALSAPIIPVIRKFNFDRGMLHGTAGEEKGALLDRSERFVPRKENIKKKISVLPSLQAFEEIGEGTEGAKFLQGNVD